MPIPVALAINDAYLNQAKVVLHSLYKNAHAQTIYDLYILNYQLSQPTRLALTTFHQERASGGSLTFLDMSDEQWQSIPVVGNWGKEASYRLFLPVLLPQLDNIIYLDADILVLGDLAHLYNVQLGECAFAAVKEDVLEFRRYHIFSALARLDDKEHPFNTQYSYINSGILVMNLPVLRAINLEQKALHLFAQLPANGLWLNYFVPIGIDSRVMPDQDILYYLAYAYTAGITYISPYYNYLPYIFDKAMHQQDANNLEYQEYIEFLYSMPQSSGEPTSPVIVHFASAHPWKLVCMKVLYAAQYQQYAKELGWNIPKYKQLYVVARIRQYIRHQIKLANFKKMMHQVFTRR